MGGLKKINTITLIYIDYNIIHFLPETLVLKEVLPKPLDLGKINGMSRVLFDE